LNPEFLRSSPTSLYLYKYKKSRKMLSRFYIAFATVYKIDPSRTVGIAASEKMKKVALFFIGGVKTPLRGAIQEPLQRAIQRALRGKNQKTKKD